MDDIEKERLVKILIEEIDKYKPWEWCPDIWKTESQYWSFLRGSFRSIWSRKWIPKNNYLRDSSFYMDVKDDNGNQKYYKTGKKKGQPVVRKHFKCEVTGEVLPMTQSNVDHIEPAGSLTNGYEACIFLFRLLTSPSNMRLISKDAHAIITHMERNNLTWDEAVLDKKVIEKLKLSVGKQKKILSSGGYTEMQMSNRDKRKACFIEMLSNK